MTTIAEQLEGKRILVWGYGREGKSTERFIKDHVRPKSLTIYEGKKDGIDEDQYDVIIKSPGIMMEEDDPKVTSQTELFLSQFRSQTVGITGTKGKSTTSAMLYTALRAAGTDAILVGNIGQPCLDDVDLIHEDTVVVYEMSCHQLWHTHVAPHIAVFLNLFEEHLDYYGTLEKYFHAKAHIAEYEVDGDIYYRGWNVPDIAVRDGVIVKTLSQQPDLQFDLTINGGHNQYNAGVVYKIAVDDLHKDPEKVRTAIEGFTGLPHRLELIATIGEVRYYDDSISTIPAAAIGAARSIPGQKTILIGGMDRGIDYSMLTEFMGEHSEIIFILAYATGERIYQEICDLDNCYLVKDLEEQTALAKKITPCGGAVILSPAAPSYGYFKNFEERGDRFRELVTKH